MVEDLFEETKKVSPNNWLYTSNVFDSTHKPFDFGTLHDNPEFTPELTIKLEPGKSGLREEMITVLLFDRELREATNKGTIPTITEFGNIGNNEAFLASGQTAPLTYSGATLNQLKDPGYYFTVFRLNRAEKEVFINALKIILEKLNNKLLRVGIATVPLPTVQS